MSFNDVAKPRQQVAVRSSISSSGSVKQMPSGDPLNQISDDLQGLQKNCLLLKDKITEMRRRRVGTSDKAELDTKIRELRGAEQKLQVQFDSQNKTLESIPRSEANPKRLAINKLQKDYERLKQLLQALAAESQLIKVSTESISTNRASGFGDMEEGSGDVDRSNNKQKKMLVALKEVDIDTLIVEERERDIKKISQDILLVNEMFRDMATIVEKQNSHIEQIAVSTEQSHEKAQQGLEQIKQASQHQAACLVS